MPWPVHPTGFFGARGDNDSYKIERSLRFNSVDSAYLNRTFSAPTSQSVFTLSLWVKLGILGTSRQLFGVSTNHSFGLTSGDALNLTFAGTSALTTTALFRDPSAWYHIVWTQNSNAHTIYVNGMSISAATATSNTFNTAVAHQLGAANTTNYFNGYLTEINFIDGQALTPSSFGETDSITGRWKAKAYSGTYGANGFYLSFRDNTSTTTLGYDDAGSNDWTLNNFSVTAGAGNDSLVDSPTNYGTDTGVGGEVRGNYCTWNPLETFSPSNVLSVSNGLLDCSISAGANAYFSAVGSQAITSGKYYWEVLCSSISSAAGTWMEIGIIPSNFNFPASNPIGNFTAGYSYTNDAYKRNNNSSSSYGATWTSGDIIGVAFDSETSELTFYKNGASQGAAYTVTATSEGYYPAISIYRNTVQSQSAVANFGQRPFAYTVPSGFKALCTTNLPQPTIQKPSKYMDMVTYTGTGASNSISSLGFSPDLVWIKNRGGATSHAIYDTTRGTQAQLSSDTTGDEVTSSTGLTSFDANGFTIGTSSLVNTSGTQYVAWSWDEAPIAGMDIVSYTGNGTNRTISHALGFAPKMLIVKARTTAGADRGWAVWHTGIANTTYLVLNATSATATGTDYWNSTSPTSSVFSIGTNTAVNANNDTYISYVFAEVEGFSKFGSYTGNGLADGPFAWCGFRPKYILVKCAGAAATNWIVHDTSRNDVNLSARRLLPNTSGAEGSDNGIDILCNGFKMRSADGSTNTNASTHIFAAFAESPFKYARAR